MHPNGQIPAYEFAFGDVNPPVHAWAVLARLQDDRRARGSATALFLARVFQKLLLNFTWWVNRKDADGQATSSPAASSGSTTSASSTARKPLPDRRPPRAGRRHRVDGVLLRARCSRWRSSWRASDPAYEDMASKFFEHFVAIADAMNTLGGTGLWDEEDGFYYDQLHVDGQHDAAARALDGRPHPAVRRRGARADDVIDRLPGFKKRMRLVPREPPRPGAAHLLHASTAANGTAAPAAGHPVARAARARAALHARRERVPLAATASARCRASTRDQPYVLRRRTARSTASTTCPGESNTGLFGGNSNWRGPIWFPLNYLLIEALERYHHFYGDDAAGRVPDRLGPHA